MAPLKSLLKKHQVDEAKAAHNCQHNVRHRIQAGDKRLGIKAVRNIENFCVACALATIDADIVKLTRLRQELAGL